MHKPLAENEPRGLRLRFLESSCEAERVKATTAEKKAKLCIDPTMPME